LRVYSLFNILSDEKIGLSFTIAAGPCQALCSLFFASYDSQGYGGGIRPRLHTGV
jgi:leucyl aminopeptidase (aminopeptidase T)